MPVQLAIILAVITTIVAVITVGISIVTAIKHEKKMQELNVEKYTKLFDRVDVLEVKQAAAFRKIDEHSKDLIDIGKLLTKLEERIANVKERMSDEHQR